MKEPGPVHADWGKRQTKVAAAVEGWKGQLIDLSGRNTLLYYKDLRQGTLALDQAQPVAVEQLLASRTIRLSDLFGTDGLEPVARRARTVWAKATENFEERGLQTLFLAWGMAAWENQQGASVPAAPILLRQSNLVPRGSAEEDFDLSLPGDWEINPTLLHMLATDFGIRVDGDALLDLLDPDAQPPDAGSLFERITKEAREVEGFSVRPRVVIGNFSYAKLPIAPAHRVPLSASSEREGFSQVRGWRLNSDSGALGNHLRRVA